MLPRDGTLATVNPPTLRWAPKRGPYRVRISQNRDFPEKQTQTVEREWALWNPHRQLEEGLWYWQLSRRANGARERWSQVSSFRIGQGSRVFVTPTPRAMLAKVRRTHPRILIEPDEIEAFRDRVRSLPETRFLLTKARQALRQPVPREEEGVAKKRGKNAKQAQRFADWASKKLGGRILRNSEALVKAWLITGDERYGQKALQYALAVAAFDPNGVTAPEVSDFADGACLMTLALCFDSCHSLLDKTQSARILAAIRIRASRLYRRWHDRLEAQFFAAHTWQTILRQFAYTAFATLGEIPEARTWASYVYEIWIGRVPLLGEADGGWANGNNYFRTNFDSLVYIPLLFRDLTGVDFFSHPWYRNTIGYMVYTWPPGSRDAGFGDGYDRRGLPHLGYLAFMDVLSRELSSPLAAWYVKKGLEDSPSPLAKENTFAWYRLRRGSLRPPPQALETLSSLELPKGRSFAGIGVVSMHSHLADIPRDLHVAFRSSPFGAFNHAHADQNSVNLLIGGQPLLYGSGYYIAYADPHYKGWYKHSRGHNTILIDDKGQAFQPQAFGSIRRFLSGEQIQYTMGDASHAYPGTGLQRFQRHVVILDGNTVLIYDDLTADHPASWTWSMHSPGTMQMIEGGKGFEAHISQGSARIDLISSSEMGLEVSRKFVPPADNWRGIEEKRGVRKVYADQSHGIARSRQKQPAMRILALIQVASANNKKATMAIGGKAQKSLHVGEWRIQAMMDPKKPASLLIENTKKKVLLLVDRTRANFTNATKQTILTEGVPPRTLKSPQQRD